MAILPNRAKSGWIWARPPFSLGQTQNRIRVQPFSCFSYRSSWTYDVGGPVPKKPLLLAGRCLCVIEIARGPLKRPRAGCLSHLPFVESPTPPPSFALLVPTPLEFVEALCAPSFGWPYTRSRPRKRLVWASDDSARVSGTCVPSSHHTMAPKCFW